jgi:acyl-CoA thioester hydrolase
MEVRTRVEIRWRDLDQLGHLNQAVYHELLEEGRGALFGSLGDHSFPFVLAHVDLDYRNEVRKDHGYVEVVSRVARLGRTSVTIEQRIELPDGVVAAEGGSVLVAWDMEERRSRELSPAERDALGATASRGTPS